MRAKKYLFIALSVILVFILFHLTIWNLYTKQLFQNDNNITIGDLGRMSYHNDSFFYKQNTQNLPKKHIEFTKIENVDVITIGDSFSNGAMKGVNPFYQDYISSNYNLKVLNLQPFLNKWIETILILNNSGVLDKLHPKSIILQSVERSSISRLSKKIDWNITLNKNDIIKEMQRRYINDMPKPSFINNLNYNALLYKILYKYDDNAFFSKVYISKISKNLFSSQDEDTLLFYFEDIKNIKQSNQKSVELLNDNLNKIQAILEKKNIKLYFMPTADKYNIYSKYIVNNKYEQSHFFELLRGLKKEYNFIDTKAILQKLTDQGVKDVYYSDDTHWSYKASREIFKEQNVNMK